MKEIYFSSKYFNAKDTLYCGQIFRFYEIADGYIVISRDKACKIIQADEQTKIVCDMQDEAYFKNYFDLQTDYESINLRANASKYEILQTASKLGKGVRILRQDGEEMLFSFLISQNNNIPRIKSTINKLCEALGDKREFCGFTYYTFPNARTILTKDEDFYKSIGLGYRSEYLLNLANEIQNGLIERLKDKNSGEFISELIKIKGIGEKVANCACLFGFYKTDCFPVDVWIEKIYREDFNGQLKNRKKITEFFIGEFGIYSGYFQQYLFYYKRSLEKNLKKSD